jgi:hypothetical protein
VKRRLTEGLRAYMEDHQGIMGAPYCECRLCETARALLSANPPQCCGYPDECREALDEEIALHAREARQHAQERDSDGENWHLAVADALRDVRDGMRGRVAREKGTE